MGLIQTSRQSTGGGGGGVTITGWQVDNHTQTTNFIAGAVVITLSQTPLSAQAIVLNYNGQIKYVSSQWSLSGNQITILFADPYVTDYDDFPVFNIQYPY